MGMDVCRSTREAARHTSLLLFVCVFQVSCGECAVHLRKGFGARLRRRLQCPPAVAPAFTELWDEACAMPAELPQRDSICRNFRASSFFQSPQRLVSVATRAGEQGYAPDTSHLRRALAQAALQDRPLQVMVFGTSVTAGTGCDEASGKKDFGHGQGWRWTALLQRLSRLAGSPLRMEVTNMAHRGSTLATRLPVIAGLLMGRSPADIFVIDYTMNGPTGQAVRDLIAMVQSLPGAPAVLFLETFYKPVLDRLMSAKSDRERDPCSVLNFTAGPSRADYAVNPQWAQLKELSVPVLSYPDVACELPDRDKPDPGLSHLTFWHSETNWGPQHPTCGVHAVWAHMVFQYLTALQHEACTGAGGYKAAATAQPRRKASMALSEEQRCFLAPRTHLSPENGFPAVTSEHSAWAFGEDVRGKPGWIANWNGTSGDADIGFDVELALGFVRLEYLSTYTDVGSVTCWIQGEENGKPGRLTINARWEHANVSLSNWAQLRASAGSHGKRRVWCRSDRKHRKFKILSLMSC